MLAVVAAAPAVALGVVGEASSRDESALFSVFLEEVRWRKDEGGRAGEEGSAAAAVAREGSSCGDLADLLCESLAPSLSWSAGLWTEDDWEDDRET